ncbi:MAG: mandelate racemase/muconate lactonizing enzyme family protein [Paenibacillaceae bacterium]|nr:mandelate racemase/muconate lactonizing enzyme family protein [Paenibacillaceae bacterium]
MKITSVACYLCGARTASGYEAGSAIVRVETDEGAIGHGESLVGLFCGEVAEALTRYYEPLLIGRNAAAIAEIRQTMFDSSVWWGRSGAAVSVMGAIENALWDIAGKAAGKPVYRLLRENAPASLPIYASMGPAPQPEEVGGVIARLQRAGFKAVKIGLSFREPDGALVTPAGNELLRRMEAVLAGIRREAGDSFRILVDGHMGGIPNPIGREEALSIAKLLERYNVRFFEEPLSYLDPEGYAWLRERTSVAIAGGESLATAREFASFLSIGALGIVQPDVNYVGGIGRFAEAAQLAADKGLPVVPHSWCGGPGMIANVHMAFAFANVEMLEMGEELTDLQQATLPERPRLHEGTVLPPTLPGLGIHFEPELAEQFPFVPGTAERASGVMNVPMKK